MDIVFYRYSLLSRGGDRVVVEYANHLVGNGCRVVFVLHEMDTVFDLDARVEIQKVASLCRGDFLLRGLLSRYGGALVVFDIVHHAPFLSWRNRTVYLAQADDVEYYAAPVMRKVVDLLYRWYLGRGGRVISDHKGLTDTFVRRYGDVACHTVPIGISHEMFFPDPDLQLVAEKNGRSAIFFMFRGDRYRKGIDIGLETLRELSHSAVADDLEVWVCGDALDESEIGIKVRNFGRVSDARLRQVLSSADIFFYPSRHEGFGLFPLEAMACGCVVVTTDAVPYANNYECIYTARIGAVDELSDAIQALVRSGERRALAREAGFRVVETFDMKKSKEQFLEVVQEMMREVV